MAPVHKVAPWLCSLMDWVLSIKQSQIYWQSAFNQKQVAPKLQCIVRKDANLTKTHNWGQQWIISVNMHVTKRTEGQTPWARCKRGWWMEGGSEHLKVGSCCQVLYRSSIRVISRWRYIHSVKMKVITNLCACVISVSFSSVLHQLRVKPLSGHILYIPQNML